MRIFLFLLGALLLVPTSASAMKTRFSTAEMCQVLQPCQPPAKFAKGSFLAKPVIREVSLREVQSVCGGAGDRAAFGRLITQYQDRVFNLCLRICGNAADAEDYAQEAFIKATRSIDHFDGRSRFFGRFRGRLFDHRIRFRNFFLIRLVLAFVFDAAFADIRFIGRHAGFINPS